MPQRRKPRTKKRAPVGPFDLSTRKLLGGTEMEAVTTGFALERERVKGYGAGYIYAAGIANQNILKDATQKQPYIIAEAKTGILRSQNVPQLFTEFGKEMVENFSLPGKSDITKDEFARGDAWKRVLGLSKNTPLTGPLDMVGQKYIKLKDGVFLHHRHDTNVYPPSPLTIHPNFRIAY